ncbi:NAD-P-binding protein [Calocera viscosa TUFC12733]|uniref:NAD-P-binding protein n=1 Tax=Calocera viscosa (strain TUFC12733) TaxID=1330018 RepID=A0A167LBU5_CALVF|nr:NAD-P-binding protein [Calocera viscosa TUFC12733]
MVGYRTFAVAGAGNVGKFIIEELVKLREVGTVASVDVLTRSPDDPKLKELGVTGLKVDYNDPPTLEAALKGKEVVISTLGRSAFHLQELLGQAAKKAGVKLFIPSEFGNPTEGREDSWFAQKNAARQQLKDMGMPYMLVYNGPFPDFVFNAHMGWDLPNGKVQISGKGDTPISFTQRRDIGRFVAHVLTSLSPEELEWRTFRIEGDRTTMNKVAAEYEQRSGKKLEVSHRSVEEVQEAVRQNPNDVPETLRLDWEMGGGIVGTPEQLANKVYPDWNPTRAVDVLLKRDGY